MKTPRFYWMVACWLFCIGNATVRGGITFTNLFSFSGTNGIEPEGQLLQTPDRKIYGTARDTTLERWGNANFGFNGDGNVFRITTNGDFAILAAFVRPRPNDANPRAGLTLGDDGILYGTTVAGGTNHQGTVYSITTNGILKNLASFGGTNGTHPCRGTGLVKTDNGLYVGTTCYGGIKDLRYTNLPNFPAGWGTVFACDSQGSLRTLHFFDNTNGARPDTGLILGKDGNFYGTTTMGGLKWLRENKMTNDVCGDGFGTIFKMTPEGILTTLVAFNGCNGKWGESIAQAQDGSLYGITGDGGGTVNTNEPNFTDWTPFTGVGTVFKINTNGEFSTLFVFDGRNGKFPDSFILGRDGNFYGTAELGGAHNLGTIFRITPSGKFTPLYDFAEGSGSWQNHMTLMQGIDGNLYGTTTRKGRNTCGSIFRLTLQP